MAEHFSYLKRVIVKKTTDQILDFLKQVNYKDTVITDLRRIAIKYNDNFTITVTRCFICAPDSGLLQQVGWVLNDRVLYCLVCTKEFNATRWKHHCRACGNLVCNNCSNFNSLIEGMEDLGKLKVCKACYDPKAVAIPVHDSRNVGQSLLPGSPLNGTTRVHSEEVTERVVRKPAVLTYRPFQQSNSDASSPTKTSSASKSPTKTANKATKSQDGEELVLPEVHVVPHPGYVIKTRRLGSNPELDEEKVFINVYHHDSIKDLKLALHDVAVPTSSVHDTKDSAVPPFILPKIYLGIATDTKDKGGNLSSLYNVVISSDYFAKDTLSGDGKKSTDVSVVQKIIEVINKTYQDNLLEDEYVRPRIKSGHKGEKISRAETFVLSPVRVSTIMRIRDDDTRSVSSRASPPSASIGSTTQSNNIKQPVMLSKKALSHNSSTYASLNHGNNNGGGIGMVNMSPSNTAADSMQPRKQSSVRYGGNSDEVSVLSDATFNTTSEASVLTVTSKQSASQGVFGSRGKKIVNEDMMKMKRAENISSKEIETLLAASIKDPRALLGWQIMVHVEDQKSQADGIFVVTGLRKNALRKTEYRLSAMNKADQWVKLKRNETKGDVEFSPLRFVINFV